MAAGDLGGLGDNDWDRLQGLIARFETAWVGGERPRIGDFVPENRRLAEALLPELVHAELEFRIKAGEPARVEEYLRLYPALAADRATALGLIRAEWDLRRRREPGLRVGSYRERFPEFADELGEGDSAAAETLVAPIRSGRAGINPPGISEGPLPRRLGKFELRARVGAGSFGVVYRAWDTVLNREVALKVPRPEAMAAPSDVRVFLREARNAVGLQHPHIVAVHDAGPIEGTVCVVRAFIDGTTLAERLEESPLTPEEAASLMAAVAEALDHAHARGIVHRDLKPSNILLDREGRPHVSDFGLAKREAGDTTLSPAGAVGAIIGTPAYMPPEQARGEAHRVDARGDVYSAGVVLYELLTGSVPFRGRGRMLQVQIQGAEPTPPRALNDDVPRDLETICLRALAKSPSDRYPTAQAMADDLRNFLRGRPVGPRPGEEKRPAPWPRRTSMAVAGALLALNAGLAGLGLVAEVRRRAHAEALLAAIRWSDELASLPHDPGLDAVHARLIAWLPSIDPGGDPRLRDALARSLARVAGRESSVGSDRVAAGLWARAARLAEEAAVDRPGDLAAVEATARALHGLAGVRARLGSRGEADRLTDRVLALWGQIIEAARDRPDVNAPLDRAEALVEAARVGLDAGRDVDLDEAEAAVGSVAGRSPLDPARRRRLARLLAAIARGHLDDGQPSRALHAASRAIRLAEGSPPDPDPGLMADLARALLASGSARRDLGQPREALDDFRRAAERFEAPALADPNAVEHRRDLGRALAGAGRLLLDPLDRPDEAIDALRRALEVRLALRRSHPESPTDLAGLAANLADLGRAFGLDGRPAASAAAYLRAIALDAGAVALAPGVESHRRDLARHAGDLAGLARPRSGDSRAPSWLAGTR